MSDSPLERALNDATTRPDPAPAIYFAFPGDIDVTVDLPAGAR